MPGTEGELAIAGPGAPLVAEFCVPEFALAIGASTDSGHRYLGDAVETRYRLPRLWARVLAGEVPVWKARRIAQATHCASRWTGAGFVDRHVAPVAGNLSYAQLERTVEEARTRFDPDAADQRRRDAADSPGTSTSTPTRPPTTAPSISMPSSTSPTPSTSTPRSARSPNSSPPWVASESLDVRRAMAAGHLARHQLALDLNRPDTTEPAPAGRTVKPRQVVIYVHLSQDALDGIGRCENTRTPVSVDQVRDWCQTPDTQITIRPVIDLNTHYETAAYTPTEAIREQVWATFPTCVFPRCSRKSTVLRPRPRDRVRRRRSHVLVEPGAAV